MGKLLQADELVEPVPVDDLFVSGLGTIEDLGVNCRHKLFVWEQTPGGAWRAVKAKLVMPADVSQGMAREILDWHSGPMLRTHHGPNIAC